MPVNLTNPRIEWFSQAEFGSRQWLLHADKSGSAYWQGTYWSTCSVDPENLRFRIIQPVSFVGLDKSRNALICAPRPENLIVQLV